jgi:hypothetical protein
MRNVLIARNYYNVTIDYLFASVVNNVRMWSYFGLSRFCYLIVFFSFLFSAAKFKVFHFLFFFCAFDLDKGRPMSKRSWILVKRRTSSNLFVIISNESATIASQLEQRRDRWTTICATNTVGDDYDLIASTFQCQHLEAKEQKRTFKLSPAVVVDRCCLKLIRWQQGDLHFSISLNIFNKEQVEEVEGMRGRQGKKKRKRERVWRRVSNCFLINLLSVSGGQSDKKGNKLGCYGNMLERRSQDSIDLNTSDRL